MDNPEIIWEICHNCSPCIAKTVCKTRALNQIDYDEPPYIDYSLCLKCAQCVHACRWGAIVQRGLHVPGSLR
jgi:Fe-S-cluster-containing hydrogenase component 2